MYHPDANPWLATSSLIFLLPAIQALGACDYRTASLDTFIVATSIAFHLKRTNLLYWLDQAAIAGIVTNALWMAWAEDPIYLILLFLAGSYNVGIYVQGRRWRTLTFHENYWIATGSHATIHLVSALSGYGLRARLGSACGEA